MRAVQLGIEAQTVIALRMLRLAAGGAGAQEEAQRMIAEKIAATAEAQTAAMAAIMQGHKDHVVAKKVVGIVHKRVRANKRRLSGR